MSLVRPTVSVVGHRLGPEDRRLRDCLIRIAQPFAWFEVGTPVAEELLAAHGAFGAELTALTTATRDRPSFGRARCAGVE
jgi:hypothetical protein